MSLRTKFGVLLGLMAVAVCLALGAAWWSFSTMRGEVRDPFKSMFDVMADLHAAKRGVEGASIALLDSPPPKTEPSASTDLNAALDRADTAVAALQDNEWVGTRAGATAIRNVGARLTDARRLATSADANERSRAARALLDVHELIERIETRLVGDTQEALRFGARLEGQLAVILALCLLVAALAIALGLSLVRRWVLVPVAALRQAAERIGSGDFEHRIAVAPGRRPDELARLGIEVNAMAGLIKEMQESRVEQERLAAVGEMVRRLAHNLRNPLAGIRGLAELTRSDLSGAEPDPEDLRDNQTRIILAVDRFEKWLNELLSVTRPMQVHPSPTSVGPWLEGLIDAHRPQARTLEVRLDLQLSRAPISAPFDARHMEHAVSAVLSNALEAAGSRETDEGLVVVSAGPHPDGWAVEVRDNGPGIPLAIKDRMFRPYFTTKRDGNGIGLAIAQQVVKAHGGRIDVESPAEPHSDHAGTVSARKIPYSGTCFRIVLPMDRPPLAESGEVLVATDGQEGLSRGQDSGHRRRGEPSVHD